MNFMSESEKELLKHFKKEYQGEQILLVKKVEDGDALLLCHSNDKFFVLVHGNGMRIDYGRSLTDALAHLYPLTQRISSSMAQPGGPITTSLGTADEAEFHFLFVRLFCEGYKKFKFDINEFIRFMETYEPDTKKKANEYRIDFMCEEKEFTRKCQDGIQAVVLARNVNDNKSLMLEECDDEFTIFDSGTGKFNGYGGNLLAALMDLYPNGGSISSQICSRIISSATVEIDTEDCEEFRILLSDLLYKAQIEYGLARRDILVQVDAVARLCQE